LSENLIATLAEDFERHGAAVIVAVRKRNPSAYLKLIADLVPRHFGIDGEQEQGTWLQVLKALGEASASRARNVAEEHPGQRND
jgi:hypothetical protein